MNFTNGIQPELGKKVRELRIWRGWTQRMLAYKAGISRVTLSRLECGHDEPSALTLGVG